MDLTAAGLFRNAIVFQNGTLTLGSGTAMAAHGRHNIRRGANALEFLGNVRRISTLLAISRLAAVKQTVLPGLMRSRVPSRLSASRTALGNILNMGIVHLALRLCKT